MSQRQTQLKKLEFYSDDLNILSQSKCIMKQASSVTKGEHLGVNTTDYIHDMSNHAFKQLHSEQ